MTALTQISNKEFILTNELLSTGSETSITFTIDETPNFTYGVVKINLGSNSEWVPFTGVTDNGDGTYTFIGCARGLNKNATSKSDVSNANKKEHKAGVVAKLVLHSVDSNEFWQKSADTSLSGDNTFTGTNQFTSTTKAGFVTQSVTSAQQAALTGVTDGAIVYDSDSEYEEVQINGSWVQLSDGVTYQNATESVRGIVEAGSRTDNENAVEQGESYGHTVLRTTDLAKTGLSSEAPLSYKAPIMDASGVIARLLLPLYVRKFGGDGSDGDLQANTDIATNNYSVKNYLTVQGGSYTLSGSGQNQIVHIKVAGDADFTDWTINLSECGGAGGVGGELNTTSAPAAGGDGLPGTKGSSTYVFSDASLGGSGGTGSGTGADAALTSSVGANLNSTITSRHIFALAGGGGAGGGAGHNYTVAAGSDVSEAGGNGGTGGGAVIIEVAGDITFSSTTINVSGGNGEDGYDGTGSGSTGYGASGGGGGGAGGTVIILCSGTITGSPTINVSGGTGGALGASGAANEGGGGAGGASMNNDGSAGSSGAGGNGADGESITLTNHAFA